MLFEAANEEGVWETASRIALQGEERFKNHKENVVQCSLVGIRELVKINELKTPQTIRSKIYEIEHENDYIRFLKDTCILTEYEWALQMNLQAQ